jgi:hypothetical protein
LCLKEIKVRISRKTLFNAVKFIKNLIKYLKKSIDIEKTRVLICYNFIVNFFGIIVHCAVYLTIVSKLIPELRM